MPDLTFQVESAEAVRYAVAPTISFRVRLINANREEVIHSVMLRCQIQMEVTQRHYNLAEQGRLKDLFGEPQRWSQTLRNMLWTHASAVVQRFAGETIVDVAVPCSFDLNLAATKFLYGIREGVVPLAFLFSGSIFYQDGAGALQAAPVPWDKEAKFRLPVSTWNQMIDEYYPSVAWVQMRRDVFDRLYCYKVARGIPTWEQTLESLLPPVEESVGS